MNLLPLPRRADLSDTLREFEEPVVSFGGDRPAEGYRLTIPASGPPEVEARDPAGAFYAAQTLAQLRHAHDGQLPVGRVDDWPDLAVRGVMLDVSRDKVPTMATLFALVDRLASWKINQLQLYTEHTFAYRDHEEVWRDASPFTAAEIRELDAFCAARHVELVPNQNCLGHWDRWLRHERYRPLALCPDGYERRGRHREPTTLDPTSDAALALVQSLLAELLPNFSSRRIHVGLDEPWELPKERLGDYLEWLRRLRGLPELAGREMLVWGDILEAEPANLAAVPDGVTICEWGYDDWHPYDARAAAYEAAAVPFWLCPGTSSWLTVLGRWTNMVNTCALAASAAVDHGGAGLLNTDWGDMGHLQYLPISEPGLAYGAAVSWCVDANRTIDLEAALSTHAFDDPTGEIGAALHELGDVHRIVAPQIPNMSVLLLHLYFPQLQLNRGNAAALTVPDLGRTKAALAAAIDRVGRARIGRADGPLVVDELRAGAALVDLMIDDAIARIDHDRDGWLRSIPETERLALADRVTPIIDRHRELWLARNRPGGLADSARWLEHLRDVYRSGTPEVAWGGW